MKKYIYAPLLALLAVLFVVDPAFANVVPQPQGGLALDSTQTYVVFIGALVPLATYVLNHYAPWADEKVKGIVQVVVAAVAGGLYQALSSGIGFNVSTLQIVGTSVVAALLAHKILWAPSSIASAFGGGSNNTKTTTA